MVSRLIASLQRFATLSASDASAMEGLITAPRAAAAGEDLVAEGGAISACRVLLAGQAFRHKMLPDGRRQILGFLIPGDIIDLQCLLMGIDHNVTALTPCELGLIPHAKLAALMSTTPAVNRALWRAAFAETAIAHEWMVGMGRRSAYGRIAHLFCEITTRLRAVGLIRANRCSFPVTQQHLSDALGLSAVHTNRTLQQLRGEGLLTFGAGELTILDWPGLQAAGEFDPAYLELAKGRG